MNAPETLSTARAKYTRHLVRYAALLAEDAPLAEMVQGFHHEAGAQVAAEGRLRELLARQRQLLGDVALKLASPASLDDLEQEIALAEDQAAIADRARRVALAGAERITEERSALAARIKLEHDQGATLAYEAARELLSLRLDLYSEALHALGRAHVAVVGSALAVDSFADVHAQPARLFTVGRLPKVMLALQLPENIPGLDPDRFLVVPDPVAFARARDEALVELRTAG